MRRGGGGDRADFSLIQAAWRRRSGLSVSRFPDCNHAE